MNLSSPKKTITNTVLVAALGYFVDVYDLVLFLIVGKKSIADLYLKSNPDWVLEQFQHLLDIQMLGMLIGGFAWGIIGDKKGRLSVLFGSIIMYSTANVLNGFVYDLTSYAILRFVAGFGLAGELGAGITLVSEVMDKEKRGFGTMIVASVGVVGAVVAGLTANELGWRTTYFIGGGLGLSLLLLRIGVFESGMFEKTKQEQVSNSIKLLFINKKLFFKYLYCVAIGLPVWFIIGIFVARAPEIAKLLGVVGEVNQSNCVTLCYGGLVFGDLSSGVISQTLKSRKKVLIMFYSLAITILLVYVHSFGITLLSFYFLVFALGYSVGFWAIFVTVASEQFGTNIRATTATTVPNLVRGSLIPIAFLFDTLKKYFGFWNATYLSMFVVFGFTLFAWYKLEETFGKELDYIEEA